jgi:hypothetical protein
MDRKVPEPRHAKEQEASRTRRLHRRCEDQVPHELDISAKRAAQADSIVWLARHKTRISFLVHFSIVRYLRRQFHRALSERKGVGGALLGYFE